MFSFLKKLFTSETNNEPKNTSYFDDDAPQFYDFSEMDDEYVGRVRDNKVTDFDEYVKMFFETALSSFPESERNEGHLIKLASRSIAFGIVADKYVSISDEIRAKVLDCLIDEVDYQKLHTIFILNPLKWDDFDRCCELCLKHDIYPYAYSFLKRKPQKPKDFESALSFVRVNQLRQMLKTKISDKIPSRKDEVLPLFAQHFEFTDMDEIIETRLLELNEQFSKSILYEKISMFGYFIVNFADNLANYYRKRILYPNGAKGKLELGYFVQEDEQFIKLYTDKGLKWCFDESGYLTNVPPLFPGDYSRIDFYRE